MSVLTPNIVMAGLVPAIHGLFPSRYETLALGLSRDVIPDKPRSGAIRNPCHDGSEELR
jgi:hypothetical protein